MKNNNNNIPGNSYSFNVAFAALKYFKKPNSDGNKNNNARPLPDAPRAVLPTR